MDAPGAIWSYIKARCEKAVISPIVPAAGRKITGKQPADDCICGVCRQPNRVNFSAPDCLVATFPGRGTDEYACFENWSMEELKERVRLVQELDHLADRMVAAAVNLCRCYEIQEETIYVPQKRKVLVFST